MKSVIKKFTACLLALTMVLGMSTVAMAATSSNDTGSITVNGLSGGETVSAYQIAKATYDDEGNFLGYENETNYRAVCIALIIGCVAVIAEVILIRREVQKSNVRRGRRRRRRRR